MQKKYQQKGVKRGEKADRRDKTTTQTIFNDNGFLAGLGTKEENDNRNNNKQQRTTRGFLAGLGTERRKRQLEQHRTTMDNKTPTVHPCCHRGS